MAGKALGEYQNGILFGIGVGALVYFVSSMTAAPVWLSWYSNAINHAANWIVSQSWYTWSFGKVGTVAATWFEYGLSMLIGLGIGVWIEAK